MREREVAPFVYAGVAILSPCPVRRKHPTGHSRSTSCSIAPSRRAGSTACSFRFYGLQLEGVWMHVGTPEAIAAAERAILSSAA
jgi:MurNAc alpha-1-phosphate uridylyltransferase